MSLYEKMKTASENRDVDAYLECIHDDFVFVRHQSGAEMSKEEWTPMLTAMMQGCDGCKSTQGWKSYKSRNWCNADR